MPVSIVGYDLWDRLDGNMIADFDELEAALDFVRRQMTAGGPEGIYRMALCEVSDAGRASHILAEGAALVDLVRAKTEELKR